MPDSPLAAVDQRATAAPIWVVPSGSVWRIRVFESDMLTAGAVALAAKVTCTASLSSVLLFASAAAAAAAELLERAICCPMVGAGGD